MCFKLQRLDTCLHFPHHPIIPNAIDSARNGEDFTEEEEQMVDRALSMMQRPCVPLNECLLSPEILREHPFVQEDFVKRGCRDVAYPKSDAEFRELYSEYARDAPENEKHLWAYPPDFARMETTAYWEELGMPPGILSKIYHPTTSPH